jgi:hypothetical protein
MADEQYRWLDRETAERLLRGESLEAVDAATRDQAERLAKALGALAAEAPLSSGELPGEAAALAAFRKVHADRDSERATAGHRSRVHTSDDAGLVRIGGPDRGVRRPRWGRRMRFGLSAALAAGMVGSVAVAAGTGVLPTPFGGGEPAPGASVSAAVTPEHPLVSPSPNAAESEPTPDGSTNGSTGPGSSSDGTARDGSAPGSATGSDRGKDAGGSGWSAVASACRDVRDGKELSAPRRHTLEGAAGGSSHVWKYCKGVLAAAGSTDGDGKGQGKGNQGGQGNQNGQGNENGQGGDDEGHHIVPGADDNQDGGTDTPSSAVPLLPKATTTSQSPSPSPTYSAL